MTEEPPRPARWRPGEPQERCQRTGEIGSGEIGTGESETLRWIRQGNRRANARSRANRALRGSPTVWGGGS